MKVARQPDLFGDPQPDLFGAEPAPPAVFRGDPDRVRGRLQKILAEARASQDMPWDRATLRLYKTIVPQMVLWLADDEAMQWRLAFDEQVQRLDRARLAPPPGETGGGARPLTSSANR